MRLVFNVDQHAVALVEGAAFAILPTQADGDALEQKRTESDSLRHAVIERALPMSHFGTLFQQLLDLGMNMEVFRIARQLVRNLRHLL